MKVFVVIPVFNEQDNVIMLHASLEKALQPYDHYYIFVDDASADQTVSTLETLLNNESGEVIRKEKNMGPGHSFNQGFEKALLLSQSTDDCILTLEGDNTSDMNTIPLLFQELKKGAELILPSVYTEGGGIEKTNAWRLLLSRAANTMLRLRFGLKQRTLTSFYRLYSVELMRKIQNEFDVIIREKGFTSMIEILVKANLCKAIIMEVHTQLLSSQRKGKSKMNVGKTMLAHLRILLVGVR
ncbi:MAG: glycosyltransferase [Bacteroidota bacterium]